MPDTLMVEMAPALPMPPSMLRRTRVGDLVPRRMVGSGRARRLEATAFVLPGPGDLGDYARRLVERADDFAAWDGQVAWLEADGDPDHLVAVVDRYGQVYEVTATPDTAALPSPDALEEWFRFLATACPECGVLDDPRPRDWVP
jgi:hypothetical protein